MTHPPTIHATCVVLGPAGVLIRGPAGAGKSLLAWTLIEHEREAGRPAALVADDRVHLRRDGMRLLATPPDSLAGMIELRGIGIVAVTHRPEAAVALVVDLVTADAPRLPTASERTAEIDGLALPRLVCERGAAAVLVRAWLSPDLRILPADS